MRFEDKIRCLALLFPLSITSWIRSKKRNASLPNAAANSMHLLGLAVDVVLDDNGAREYFMSFAKDLDLVVIDENDHLHVMEPHR